jgi:cyanophycin synthetase
MSHYSGNTIVRVTKKNEEFLTGVTNGLTRLMAQAAIDLGYTVEYFSRFNFFRIQAGTNKPFVWATYTTLNTYVSGKLSDHKFITDSILHDAGLPVSDTTVVKREEFIKGTWDLSIITYPAVVKPARDTLKGEGVLTSIQNEKDLLKYMRKMFITFSSVIIQPYHAMRDYRVLVLDGRVIAASYRIPAYVIGDGINTVRTLIREKNKLRNAETQKMGPITIDDELRNTLKNQKIELDFRPKNKQYVQLKNVCNVGAGGEVEDVTDQLCKENKQLAIRAAKVMGLRFVGVDLMCKDIRKPITKKNGVIIEVNPNPDIALHHFPQKGVARNVAKQIVKAIVE